MIGTEDEAAKALRIVRGLRDPRREEFRTPGWARAGQGTTRIALRGPSGMVYKVPCPLFPNWGQGMRQNRQEAEHFARWEREGRNFVAEWHLYEVGSADGEPIPIMAMEFVESDGTEPTNMDEVWSALAEVDAEDRHPGNFRVRAGKAIIIDAGGAASSAFT